MLKKLFFILISGVCALSTSAQQLEWSVDMNAVLNNREGGNNETPAQTFIFTRITPQIGVSMDHGRHSIMGGVTWYQPMIDNLAEYKVLPALHYHYKDSRKGYEFKFGVIPNELNNNIALFLRSDSINYVQPNIKGAVINIQKPHFWLYSWFDWRQFRTNYKREAFDATAQVGWRTTKGSPSSAAPPLWRRWSAVRSRVWCGTCCVTRWAFQTASAGARTIRRRRCRSISAADPRLAAHGTHSNKCSHCRV